MKKNGFTLAEVLITLAIIGVVATLTLPALMTNTQEQQAKTALKKGINTLTEAAQMNQAISGFDYATLTSDKTDDSADDEMSLYRILADRTSVDYQRSGESSEANKDSSKLGTVGSGTGNYVIFFRDGSALSFNPANTKKDSTAAGDGGKVGSQQDDGLAYGIAALLDTNGKKGPNVLSNCQGSLDATEDKTGNCSQKSQRFIKDQFGVRLRNGYAVPNGMAARWAFEN